MDLFGKSLIELQELIKTKKVSSKEVFDYFAKRSKKYNPKLNAFHTLLDKPVTESSATGGSLYGIPFSMKDTYNTKGVQTTASSRVIDDYIPPYNATVYERLVKAGAVLLGKSNCDAWGHGSSTENSDLDLFVIGKEKKINLRKYEERLGLKIHLFFESDLKKIPKELKNNLVNGIVLKGYLKLF